MKRNVMTLASLLLALVLLSAAFSGCGASETYAVTDAAAAQFPAADYGDYSGKAAASEAYAPSLDVSYSGAETAAAETSAAEDTRKIVKTVSLSLETKDFDSAVAKLASSASAFGGYVENSNIEGRSYGSDAARTASYTLRVPAARLDEYVASLGSDGEFNVLSKSESSQDITDSYYDSKSRLDSLKTQEERLLAMLEGATDLQYMIQIEDKLADVRYQIENYNTQLQIYDKQVAMSTVTISLVEVIEYQEQTAAPRTFGERIFQAFTQSWSGFADGCRDFAVGFVYAVPTLLVLAVIILALIFIIRAAVRHNRKKKAAMAVKEVPLTSDKSVKADFPDKNASADPHGSGK